MRSGHLSSVGGLHCFGFLDGSLGLVYLMFGFLRGAVLVATTGQLGL